MEFLYDIFYIFYSQVMTKAPLATGFGNMHWLLVAEKRRLPPSLKVPSKRSWAFMLVQVGAGTLVKLASNL